MSAFELFRLADGTPSIISPGITAKPVEVLAWVRDTVTPDDEAWITGIIRGALDRWEHVRTANIRFSLVTVRSTTPPPRTPQQLLVVVANIADLTTGGATPPVDGHPGTWWGAVADFREVCPRSPCSPMELVAAHEIGHAIGLLHTTVSDIPFGASTDIPIMYFAIRPRMQMTPDDEAAVSLAYPNPERPLERSTGTIRGTCISPLVAPPLTQRREQRCQRAVGRAVINFGLRMTRCLLRCDSPRRSKGDCAEVTDHGSPTPICMQRAARRVTKMILTACGEGPDSEDCPHCFDLHGDCDPQTGFTEWMVAGSERPLSGEAAQATDVHAHLFCDDTKSPDGLTVAESSCRQMIALAAAKSEAAIRRCYLICHERRQAGRLPDGTTCTPRDPQLDPRAVACLEGARRILAARLSCDVPECAVAFTRILPGFIEDSAESETALIFCDAPGPKPINGVNIVAVDRSHGTPVLARLSGAAGGRGGFELLGLAAGTYDVHFLDGGSFEGSFPGMSSERVQRDNFTAFRAGPYSVTAGSV